MVDEKILKLHDFETFMSHASVQTLIPRYENDATLAKYAVARLIGDLGELNRGFTHEHRRGAFTTIEGRVKTELSLFRKLFLQAEVKSRQGQGLTQDSLVHIYKGIKDLAGVRFSCPYLDEVTTTIQDLVLPGLQKLAYGTSLKGANLKDKDFLDTGNEHGYRSYHFYVKVPTVKDIYGHSQLCLCEIQARSELQHVWAVKSHDLLYKADQGWQFSDTHVKEDMRQVSNSLRAADQHLVSIRDRVRKAAGAV